MVSEGNAGRHTRHIDYRSSISPLHHSTSYILLWEEYNIALADSLSMGLWSTHTWDKKTGALRFTDMILQENDIYSPVTLHTH